MSPQPPSPGDVVLAIFAVIAGCIAGAYAVYFAWRNGNGLAYLCAAGCATFAVGIAAQRTFPSAVAIRTLGQTLAASSRPGPWDAGVSLPLVSVRITPVTLVGLLLAALSVSLLLLFEHRPDPARLRPIQHRALEEHDAV
ncbi:MAG: hypothetical protein ACREN2_03695 [Candidatus Dormibacteria bacterium]